MLEQCSALGGLLAIGMAFAQVMPTHLDVPPGVQVVAFVEADCPPCEALPAQLGADALYLGEVAELPYPRYLQDARNVAARTFRIEAYPTVIVLQDGQEVLRQVGSIDGEVIAATVRALEEGRMPVWRLGIEVGQPVTGQFESESGLVVIWQPGCEVCGKEVSQLLELTSQGVPVYVTGDDAAEHEAHGLTVRPSLGIHEAWRVGAPTYVYLQDGVPRWVAFGYREDLADLVGAVSELNSGR